VINAPSGQDIVYTLNGTEISRVRQVACTATGGLAKYDTCYMASPLTTTGSLKEVSLECGNWKVAMSGDLGFVKAAETGSGSPIARMSNQSLGTGAYIIHQGTGATLWNPADKLKFATLVTPTGTLNTTRYDCVMRVDLEDIYGR
jgi:hypothetical protein